MDCTGWGERLTALVDGELDATERAEVERHVARCAHCRAALDEERSLAERLRALPSAPLPAGFDAAVMARVREASPGAAPAPRGRLLRWPFVVGGAALAAGILLVVGPGRRASEQVRSASAPAPAARAPAAAERAAGTGGDRRQAEEETRAADPSARPDGGGGAGAGPVGGRFRGPAGEVPADSRAPEEPTPGGAAPGPPADEISVAAEAALRAEDADDRKADGSNSRDDLATGKEWKKESPSADGAPAATVPATADGDAPVREAGADTGETAKDRPGPVPLRAARRFAAPDGDPTPRVALFFEVADPDRGVRPVNELLLKEARIVRERLWLAAPLPPGVAGPAAAGGADAGPAAPGAPSTRDAGDPPPPAGSAPGDARKGPAPGLSEDGLLRYAQLVAEPGERVLLLRVDAAHLPRLRALVGSIRGFREASALLGGLPPGDPVAAKAAAERAGTAGAPSGGGGGAAGQPGEIDSVEQRTGLLGSTGGPLRGAGEATPPPAPSPEVLERLAGGVPLAPPGETDAAELRERFGDGRGVELLVEIHLVVPARPTPPPSPTSEPR